MVVVVVAVVVVAAAAAAAGAGAGAGGDVDDYHVGTDGCNETDVRAFFESLDLDIWDAWSFFKLLDTDGGGMVEVEEFFMGCLRFRGTARAMDVAKIIQDQRPAGHFVMS
eukprot:s135_g9.t1